MYNSSGHGHGNAETYLIQGAEIKPVFTSPVLEQVDNMYSEGTPEFVLDQGMYYPTTTNYGYYCTGFESPGEWEDHRIFGVDGPEIQYAGAQTESLPYVYYTPGYGYAQSPYNPYNPYIPGATIGVDGSFVGAQQYHTIPPYQDAVSLPGYIPVVIQPEIIPNNSVNLLPHTSDGRTLRHVPASSSAAFSRISPKPTNSLTRISEGSKANSGPGKQSVAHGSVSSGLFSSPTTAHVLQSRNSSGSAQHMDNISGGKVPPHHAQLKVSLPVDNSYSDFGSSTGGQTAVDKLRSKINVGRSLNDISGSTDALGEQNRGPRTSKSKNQLAVKAYTAKVGGSDAQGNIIIYPDQYNKDDFPVDYADAKFFVIKSYSEDDVHKSIKYNVWSSTPHGNKKLQGAYEDAQRKAAGKPKGCPILLFFSVNVSGQFCGVAEMIGPVDFQKDMDFWQQDKWCGSFPVKWHIIKDVPNTSFRHIILENNDNKPVTNSRDTQEIMGKQGLEMLKIFKNHPLKTSLLDDFMYYENRQKIMLEEKTRITFRRFETPFLVPALNPTCFMNSQLELAPYEDQKTMEQNGPDSLKKTDTPVPELVSSTSEGLNCIVSESSEQTTLKGEENIASALKIGSLKLNTKWAEYEPSTDPNASVADKPADIVTVGSMPIKVKGLGESAGFLTVGSIPLDPVALQLEKGGSFSQHGSTH